MTDITESKTVERVETVHIRTECDKCGEVIPEPTGFEHRDFTLSVEQGENYPEGGHSRGWKVSDLCDDCAAWLRKVLELNGVTIAEIEVDF